MPMRSARTIHAIIPLTPTARWVSPTTLVRDAHAVGIDGAPVHLPAGEQLPGEDFWNGDAPNTRNGEGMVAEMRAYLDAGIDAFFTDDPALGREAVDER